MVKRRTKEDQASTDQLLSEGSGNDDNITPRASTDLKTESGNRMITDNRRSRIWRRVQLTAMVVTGILSLYGTLDLGIRIHGFIQNPTIDKTSCNCGSSVAEALSLGCKFVPMASAWLPPACIDEELSSEFDKAGPGPSNSWRYYADVTNNTSLLTLSEVALLANTPKVLYYTTVEWHIVHCAYYWKKLHRSRWTGVLIEPRYDTEKHMDHCLKMFLDTTERGLIGSQQGAALNSQ
jgi:hypothetical protein